ncbi:MAG: L-idonate 5-dehydrogenase [Alphaproteobacteria bacterium]
MKAIVLHAALDLRIEDRPAGTPGPGQVAVRMAVGGICGSDLHYYNHGGIGAAIRVREPLVLGHEVSGHIAALGAGVTGLEVGQLVAVSPSRPCHACTYCRAAQFNHCLNMRFFGSAMPFPHSQGAFSQFLIAEAAQCVGADGLTESEAAMAEPLAVCLHAVHRAGPLLGRSVLVTGCGPIGLLCILAARRAGADLIVATDLHPFTLAMARQAGADVVINMTENAAALADYAQDKGSFDVLFECSGAAPALVSAIAVLRPGGTIVQLGLGGDMTLPVQVITAKELVLKGSFRFHDEFATGVSLMQKRLVEVKPLITHSFAIDDAVTAFQVAGDRGRAMKAQIRF